MLKEKPMIIGTHVPWASIRKTAYVMKSNTAKDEGSTAVVMYGSLRISMK